MPINLPGYNAPALAMLNSMSERPKMARSINQPRMVQHAQPVQMRNNQDPRVGARLKWLEGQREEDEKDMLGSAIGGGIRNFGLSLLANMGPRPQGTGSLVGDIGTAINHGVAGYYASKDQAKADMQEGKMIDALNDPVLMDALTPAQQRIVQALPPAAGMQLLAGLAGQTSDLKDVRNEAEGTLDWYDNRGNLVRRTSLPADPQRQLVTSADGESAGIVDLSTGQVESTVALGEGDPNYSYQTVGNTINVMADGELVNRYQLPAEGLNPGTPEYGQQMMNAAQDFRSLMPVKTWQETRVQIESAQQAYENNDVADNPQAQLQMIIAFAKILDPNSVVREGEVHIQTSAAGLKDKMEIALKQIWQGGKASKQMMDNLLLGIEEVGKSRYDAFIRSADQMRPIYEAAQLRGGDINSVLGDLTEPTWSRRGGTALEQLGFIDTGALQPNPMAQDATAISTRNRYGMGG